MDGRDAVAVKRNGESLGRFFHPVVDLYYRRLELLDVGRGLTPGRCGGDVDVRVVDDDLRAERGSGAVTYDEGVGLEAQHPVRAEVTSDFGERRKEQPRQRAFDHVGLDEELGDAGRGGRRGVPR